MIKDVLLGLGLIAIIEGLVLALAPSFYEDILNYLRQLSIDQRRLIGLGAFVIGIILVWIARI